MSVARPALIVSVVAGVTVIATAGVAIGYRWGAQSSAHEHLPMAAGSGRPAGPGRPLYWYDPMKPDQHFDKPGKSPFMDMPLVPKYVGEAEDSASVHISPETAQNLGLRLVTVERGSLSSPLEVVGSVGFNQRDVAVLQARAAAFVTRVYARAPGESIARGAPIADLLVPDWSGGQTEYLALLKDAGTDPGLLEAAHQRLLLLGMPEDLIASVTQGGKVQTALTVRAPRSGVITTLEVREGMTVASGATLAGINGLDSVWIEAAIPETQASLAQIGRTVTAQLTAYPGEVFHGHVVELLPQADTQTRTLRLRIQLSNGDGRLRPGLFAQVRLADPISKPLLSVASEAVIHTGMRNVVIVSTGSGRFAPTEVRTGAEEGGRTIILKGLAEGQQVVASGQFLIDSEANLSGVLTRLQGQDMPTPQGSLSMPASGPQGTRMAASALNDAAGTVKSIADGRITLDHGPVASLGWPAMTMTFRLGKPEMAQGVRVGNRVHIRFDEGPDGDFVVRQLDRAGAAP